MIENLFSLKLAYDIYQDMTLYPGTFFDTLFYNPLQYFLINYLFQIPHRRKNYAAKKLSIRNVVF